MTFANADEALLWFSEPGRTDYDATAAEAAALIHAELRRLESARRLLANETARLAPWVPPGGKPL